MKRKNFNYKRLISVVLSLVLLVTLFSSYASAEETQPANLVEGPTVMKDANSPTGYTVQFVYKNEHAAKVDFVGDIMLKNWADTTDTKVYTPTEYKPGFMRGGGAYQAPMQKLNGGYWTIEVPLAAGANQYWFYVDGNTNYWVPDPMNSPKFAPDGLTGNARRAFNAVYVPYDSDKQDELMGARVIENPRTDGKTGTWSYVEIPTQIDGKTRNLGVYLPYGYDPNREKPYKTIYMQHGSGQDASDWMNIGSVPNIMDNLLADGLTEPAVVVTTDSTYLGNSNTGYPNLRNIILPFIENNYNVSKNAADRSFAGLSMGAMITASIINYDPTMFGYYGVFSGGIGVRNTTENLNVTNILIGGGRYDFGLANPTQVAALDGYVNYKNLVVAGAHDFNTWCQLFTMYARDYLWKSSAFDKTSLDVTTTANLIKKGDYFDVKASFHESTTSNAISLVLKYDPDKFEYSGNLGEDPSQDSYIDGVTYITSDSDVGDGKIKLTMMIPDYKAKDLVSLRFRAKENADIQNTDNSITAIANFTYKNSAGTKFVLSAYGSTDFTSTGNPGDLDADGKVTLLDLSNVIDMFGVKSGDVLWTKAKFCDFNKNNKIDIEDIVAVAKLII